MVEQLIILLIIGIVAGILSGLFGIGGGVIIVPALVAIAGFGLREACGISLASLLLPVGIFAVITFSKAKLIDFKSSMLIAIGLMSGVFFGAKLSLFIQITFLKALYGVFLLFVAFRYIDLINRILHIFGKEAASKTETSVNSTKWYFALSLGLFAGVLSGLFGIGGGVVIVPILVSLLKYDQKIAAGTSLGALLLPVGLPGVLVFLKAGTISISSSIPVAIGLLFGAFFGAHLAIRIPSKMLKSAYGVFLLFIAIRFLI